VLKRAQAGETVAIVSTSRVPTGTMVTNTGAEKFPELKRFKAPIDAATDADSNVWIDAEAIARHVFASQPAANMMAVGLAYQLGRVPVSASSIERAIELNGVAVEMNRAAFQLGRRLANDPDLASTIAAQARVVEASPPAPTATVQAMVDSIQTPSAALIDVLHWRLPELIAWGDENWARSYAASIGDVRRAEFAAGIEGTPLSEVAARHLFKLMAYKDEYEVARLALENDMGEQARARFGPNAKVGFQLKPPTLKHAGYDKKITIPEAAGKATFKSLLKTKRLRGTKLDPFGRTEERRIERELIEDYRVLLQKLSDGLTVENVSQRAEVAELADMIRGFDEIKLASVSRYREAVAQAMSGLTNGD
jgi:indolepyruvate ferredoxin oxidoreductase